MIKSTIGALGSILNGIGKIASAINKSTAFKLLKGAVSATVGVPLALVGTAVTSVAWAGIKVAGLLDAKIIKGVFGSSIWEDTAWASSLQGTEKFMRSMWEDFGVYAHLKAAKFIGDEWARRQSEAGYGHTINDIENKESSAALSNGKTQTEQVRTPIKEIDKKFLSPSPNPSDPSGSLLGAENSPSHHQ